MCVDYSQTVNKFTHLDAYPLPDMRSFVNNVAQNQWFSKLDLLWAICSKTKTCVLPIFFETKLRI